MISSDGVIAKGADLIVDYEVLDSGNIVLHVSVPSIGSSFNSGQEFLFLSRGTVDYSKVSERIKEESEQVSDRLDEIATKIDNPKLDQARMHIERATAANGQEGDAEAAKQAMDDIQEARKLLALARKQTST